MKVETDCFYLILLVGFYFLKKVLYFHHSHLYNLYLIQTFSLLI